MKKMKNLAVTVVALTIVLDALTLTPAFGQLPSNVSVFATGLNNPRGLKFGPDGYLYVAEGGIGGSNFTVGCCEQAAGLGPYAGSVTGSRISKINATGFVTTAVDNLPSSQTNPDSGSLISGAADVAFIRNTLYVLLAGAGCSHGVPQVPEMPNGVIRVNADGTRDLIANLSAFQMAFPVAHPNPDDFEPDGTWYSMITARGDGNQVDLYAVEPNHGELDRITPDGQISRVIDISASQGHIVPTAVAARDNDKFYVGNLDTFPIVAGSSKVYEISKNGRISAVAEGLSAVTGVAIDSQHRMYVLEMSTSDGGPNPGDGKVVRMNHPDGGPHDRDQTVIADGLTFPTAMTFGPDGALYVSNVGFGAPPDGEGQILKITVP
ncbi:MAG: ScyD/ScyE family protein [Candidatus Udaeobacter sp.]